MHFLTFILSGLMAAILKKASFNLNNEPCDIFENSILTLSSNLFLQFKPINFKSFFLFSEMEIKR